MAAKHAFVLSELSGIEIFYQRKPHQPCKSVLSELSGIEMLIPRNNAIAGLLVLSELSGIEMTALLTNSDLDIRFYLN